MLENEIVYHSTTPNGLMTVHCLYNYLINYGMRVLRQDEDT